MTTRRDGRNFAAVPPGRVVKRTVFERLTGQRSEDTVVLYDQEWSPEFTPVGYSLATEFASEAES